MSDGRIDLGKIWNQRRFVSPDENLLAQIYRIVGDRSVSEAENTERCRRLGIEARDPLIRPISDFVFESEAVLNRENDSDQSLSEVGIWLQENESAINDLVRVSQLGRFYSPIVTGSDQGLESFDFIGFNPMREANRILARRCNYRMQMGDVDGVLIDLIANLRIARTYLTQSSTILDNITAVSILEESLDQSRELIATRKLDISNLELIAEYLEPESLKINSFENHEFFGWFIYDAVQVIATNKIDFDAFMIDEPLTRQLTFYSKIRGFINLEAVVDEIANNIRARRDMLWDETDDAKVAASVTELYADTSNTDTSSLVVLAGPGPRGTIFGKKLFELLNQLDLTVAKILAEYRTRVDLMRIVCAIERYRLAVGRFPNGLNELVPEFTKQLPKDRLTGRALIYIKFEKVYLVGSAGIDGQNQFRSNTASEESTAKIEADIDDIIIKMSIESP